jgi:hypothetical protein
MIDLRASTVTTLLGEQRSVKVQASPFITHEPDGIGLMFHVNDEPATQLNVVAGLEFCNVLEDSIKRYKARVNERELGAAK